MKRDMRRAALGVALTAALGLGGAPAWAGEDGPQEHPIVKNYPGAETDSFDMKDFDSITLVDGTKPKGGARTAAIEGRVTRIHAYHPGGESALQVIRNYGAALEQAGFVKITAGAGLKLPDVEIAANGGQFAAYRLDRPGQGSVIVNIETDDVTADVESFVAIAEPKAMEQVYAVDAGKLYAALGADGHVAIYGINFDTGRAEVRPDSDAALEQVVKLMREHAQLKLRVEGHTDAVGAPEANRTLSQARADAVVRWLTAHGVEPGRLQAAGMGQTKPLASNDTEDGRARNRRVELVQIR
ncbi:OmpA family protein [Caulobacter sp. 17J65-9]|uniref:OmpA family protein n=1 Tax=Caulobacter sp. 17J65-9 TaxID=2709382 RepID=UPI0013CCA751|nr:OmpA family protein [Caulobacter sp. 17J65-9]NEX93681.1 OmpA family protein [Caulobacter sp. 17J65-9]